MTIFDFVSGLIDESFVVDQRAQQRNQEEAFRRHFEEFQKSREFARQLSPEQNLANKIEEWEHNPNATISWSKYLSCDDVEMILSALRSYQR